MKTLADYTVEERAEKLRAWAKGGLPEMAAVEFLIQSDALRNVPDRFVVVDEHENLWIARHGIADAIAEGGIGYMSGGEKATWRLASSMLSGELNDTFWSLDPERQAAFLRAMAVS